MPSNSSGAPARTIRGVAVPLLVPSDGDTVVWCVGEAPGPRGADKSGYPFFGDRAGLPLYRALVAAGACTLPEATWTIPWDGTRLHEAGIAPRLQAVAIGNAYPVCPTDNGVKFRAPSKGEREGAENLARLGQELRQLHARGLRAVLALGHVAARTMTLVLSQADDPVQAAVTLHPLPHPSAQGLLSAAPDRGRGARLHDLAVAWEAQVAHLVRSYTTPPQRTVGGHA